MKLINKLKSDYIYFMLYAILGWIYEVVLEVFIYRWGFTNRGVLFGPYCPVYGIGALLFLFFIYPLIRNKSLGKKIIMIPVVFMLSMLIATTVELVTSYLCEIVMGSWPWQTYASYPYNFQARIALSPSIRFGIGGVIFLYLCQPFFEFIVQRWSKKTLNSVFWTVLFFFVLDIFIFFIQKL